MTPWLRLQWVKLFAKIMGNYGPLSPSESNRPGRSGLKGTVGLIVLLLQGRKKKEMTFFR